MPPVLAATRPDVLVFIVASAAVLVGAIGVVAARHPVHSALFLIQTLFGIAVLFVAQQADFLAAVQIIVYAGAIVVLFLFVIMLVGVDRSENVAADPLPGQRPMAIVLGVLALLELLVLARADWISGASAVGGAANGPGDNVTKLGRSLFTQYLYAFEITSVLLIIAVIGAVVLARRPPGGTGDAGLEDADLVAESALEDRDRAASSDGESTPCSEPEPEVEPPAEAEAEVVR